MSVRLRSYFHWQHIEVAMPDAGLCDSGFGECLNPLDRSTQHNAFHAIVMIQVDVQGRDVEVVVCVMARCQTAREIALVMVEDVGQISQAVATRLLCKFFLVHALAYQVPDRFGTVLVAVVDKIFFAVSVFWRICICPGFGGNAEKQRYK
ncbi:MAG: hypothetical protein WBO73_14835 [Gammaproteobacteria bacterium]|jgi:hypothetical protein